LGALFSGELKGSTSASAYTSVILNETSLFEASGRYSDNAIFADLEDVANVEHGP